MKKSYILAAALSVVGTSAHASSLLSNGDFELGDTGFTSSFTAGGISAPDTYVITTNPNAAFSNFASYGDQTSGSGNMMLINGSADTPAAANMVWSETVAVTKNTDYTFTGWIASAAGAPVGALDIVVNNATIGSATATATLGEWTRFSFAWNSGAATSAVLELIETSEGFSGNDYSLDDLSFAAASGPAVVPLPAAGWALLTALGGLIALGRRRA